MYKIEKHYKDSKSLTILIHGVESSKEEWTTKNGYTKGGNLVQLLNQAQMSWIALDLYGHGEWTAEEEEFDREDVSDELWPKFISSSVQAFKAAVEQCVGTYEYTSLHLVTYSAGCHVAVDLLKEELPIPVIKLVMAVGTPEREYDDEYSLHNNLQVFKNREFFLAQGERDEDVSLEESDWFFEQIDSSSKQKKCYPSGHSLPAQWVDDAFSLLN